MFLRPLHHAAELGGLDRAGLPCGSANRQRFSPAVTAGARSIRPSELGLVERFHETAPTMSFEQRLMGPADQGKVMGSASLTHPTVLGDTVGFMESVY
jgi:hypothetical protein